MCDGRREVQRLKCFHRSGEAQKMSGLKNEARGDKRGQGGGDGAHRTVTLGLVQMAMEDDHEGQRLKGAGAWSGRPREGASDSLPPGALPLPLLPAGEGSAGAAPSPSQRARHAGASPRPPANKIASWSGGLSTRRQPAGASTTRLWSSTRPVVMLGKYRKVQDPAGRGLLREGLLLERDRPTASSRRPWRR